MPDGPEASNVRTVGITPSPGVYRDNIPDRPARLEGSDAAPIEIVIDRDLAVQLIGSDAGNARRMRPHGAMTKDSSDEELIDVRAVMEPFLNDEIRRVHEAKTHRLKVFLARATPRQAASLRAFCLRFAAALELNLAKHPGDDNRHRSQQRLDQARRVIAQVNAAEGIPQDDGRTLEQCRRDAVLKAEVLDAALTTLRAHADAGTDQTITPLLGLQEAVRRCLALRGRS